MQPAQACVVVLQELVMGGRSMCGYLDRFLLLPASAIPDDMQPVSMQKHILRRAAAVSSSIRHERSMVFIVI